MCVIHGSDFQLPDAPEEKPVDTAAREPGQTGSTVASSPDNHLVERPARPQGKLIRISVALCLLAALMCITGPTDSRNLVVPITTE